MQHAVKMIDGFEDEGAVDSEIRINPWCSRSLPRLRISPRRDRLFVKPYREAATIDQYTIVHTPVTDAVMKHRRWFWHVPILATTSKEGNLQQRRRGLPVQGPDLVQMRRGGGPA